ncbi:MAG: hypothetical protein GY869_15990, partial [Planctomycetes bacterium]|nr:hypothetical protein [Planctomycetota bacterium]
KAGDIVGDAWIESIEPTVVTLQYDKQRITRKPVLVAEDNSRNSRNRRNQSSQNRGRGRGGMRGGRGSGRGGDRGSARPQISYSFSGDGGAWSSSSTNTRDSLVQQYMDVRGDVSFDAFEIGGRNIQMRTIETGDGTISIGVTSGDVEVIRNDRN